MTWHEAVVEVLRQNQTAMHYADIADAIVENGLVETILLASPVGRRCHIA